MTDKNNYNKKVEEIYEELNTNINMVKTNYKNQQKNLI